MTALTESVARTFGAGVEAEPATHPVAAGAVIFKGAHTCLDGSGNLIPAASAAAADSYAGVAEEEVNNTGGAAGDLSCQVRQNYTLLDTPVTGASDRTDIGTKVYATDDDTLTTTVGTNPEVGVIENVDGSGFAVRGRAAALR